MSVHDKAVKVMCGDIDRLETVVGNVGLSIPEYREVIGSLESMISHIEVMIELDIEEEGEDQKKILQHTYVE